MARTRKRQPKPKPDPKLAVEAFLAEVPEAVYAALPADIIGTIDAVAGGLLTRHPRLEKRPLAFRALVAAGVRRQEREGEVGFDEEKCRARLDLLLEYLPLFIAAFKAAM
jgi:hypothetical protein